MGNSTRQASLVRRPSSGWWSDPNRADHPRPPAFAAESAAVAALLPALPEAIVLCEWQDFSTTEAAANLDTTPKPVGNRLYRAHNLLRDRLKRWL